jgi:hypothetical protein
MALRHEPTEAVVIDIAREHVLTLAEAAAHPSVRRDAGQDPSPAKLWRWVTRGVRGVRLDGQRRPGGWVTSLEALQRFFDALTAHAETARRAQRLRQAPTDAARAELEAEALLDEAGI